MKMLDWVEKIPQTPFQSDPYTPLYINIRNQSSISLRNNFASKGILFLKILAFQVDFPSKIKNKKFRVIARSHCF